MSEAQVGRADLYDDFVPPFPEFIRHHRDTFRFLLQHLAESTRRQVSLTWDGFTPEAILTFLENLKRLRRNSTATRNARLAAIRSVLQLCQLSVIVSTAVFCVPSVAPPVGTVSARFTVSLPSTRMSSRIVMFTVFVAVSPSAKLTVWFVTAV